MDTEKTAPFVEQSADKWGAVTIWIFIRSDFYVKNSCSKIYDEINKMVGGNYEKSN